MKASLRRWPVLGAALLVSAAAVVQTQGGAPELTAELRSRWNGLTEVERERLRERFVEFDQLDPAEKRSVNQRARRLDELARRLYRALDDEEREQLDGLGTEKRRELLREMAVESASAQGQRIMALLPAEDRSRLLAATPEDRQLFLLDFEKRQARRLDDVVRKLGPQYLGTEALARLNMLEPAERRQRFLEIFQKRVVQWVGSRGLPEGLPQKRWQSMARMDPQGFQLAWERARKKYGVDGPRAPQTSPDPARRLVDALQIDLEGQRLDMSELEPRERRARLRKLQHERVLAVARELNAEGLIGDPELAELLKASGSERFTQYLREVIGRRGRTRGAPQERPGNGQ